MKRPAIKVVNMTMIAAKHAIVSPGIQS